MKVLQPMQDEAKEVEAIDVRCTVYSQYNQIQYKEVALLYRLEGREGREARLTGPFSTPQI